MTKLVDDIGKGKQRPVIKSYSVKQINENNQTFVAKRANAYRAFLIRQTHLPRLNNMRKCFCQKMIKMVNPGLYVKADSTCDCTYNTFCTAKLSM